ncbi:TIGR04168 family protein [Trichothermofontia sp.]
MTVSPIPERPLTLAVVGDVHEAWELEDELALQHLGVDLVLLVGDFGNESVATVSAIARLPLPKAVVLGNHDAWYTATDWGRKKCPYDRTQEDRVQQQLDLLGEAHVGYSYRNFPALGLSVVGGRPFSWGGPQWQHERFYRDRYGVTSFEASTAKICQAAQQTRTDTVIFLGHCGPQGLGDQPDDPCGRDWQPLGGDFGDPDLTAAIAATRAMGKQIPLVAFGHMHHHLRYTQQSTRRMLHVDAAGTVYLNSAWVPRIIKTPSAGHRNFSLVHLQGGRVTEAKLVWVTAQGTIVSEQVLYQDAIALSQGS